MTRAVISLQHLAAAALAVLIGAGSAHAQLVADFTSTVVSGSNPLTVAFTDTTTGGTPVGWLWTFGDGGGATTQNPTHTYTTPGTYDVQLSVIESFVSQDVELKTGLVSVAPAVFDAAFSVSSVQGTNPLTVQFTDTSSGPVDSWSWDFGDGHSSSQQNPSHTYTVSAGTTSYTVSLTTSVGSQSETLVMTDLITVEPAVLVADFSADVTTGTHPLTVQFTDLSQGPVTEGLWSFGDGSFAPLTSGGSVTHTYTTGSQPTSFDVKLFIGVGDQVTSVNKPGLITAEPAALLLDFSSDVTQGVGDQRVLFTNTSQGAAGAQWTWQFGDGAQAGGLHAAHDYFASVPVGFDVTLTATIGEQVQSLTRPAAVSMAPDVFGEAMPFAAPGSLANDVISEWIAEINGDDRPDLLIGNNSGLFWLENQPGLTLGTPTLIMAHSIQPPFALTPSAVVAADLDGDADLDLVLSRAAQSGTSIPGQTIWLEHTDGLGSFGPPSPPLPTAVTSASGTAADLDGDGDLDIVFAGWLPPASLWWHENTDGLGTLGPQQHAVVTSILTDVVATDADGDGDVDLAARATGGMSWFENLDGLAGSWATHVLDTTGQISVLAGAALGDLDGDGDDDLIEAMDDVSWYERLPGGGFGPRQLLDEDAFADMALVVDVDGDGDQDVLHGGLARSCWLENLDGAGNFGPRRLVRAGAGVEPHALVDLDADGDGDVLVLRQYPAVGLPTLEAIENLTVDGDWTDLGSSLAGSGGAPELLGAGPLAPGATLSLALQDALPGAFTTLVLGTSQLQLPFKGGVMVPNPDVLLPLGAVQPHGVRVLLASWPAGVPAGIPVVAQHWIVDGAGPAGFSASNGVLSLSQD